MPDITIAASDGGSFSAYLAMPATTPAPGLVLIQEIFGVNKVMRDLADSFAKQGYVVACPDLFWRIEPGVQITDKTQAEWDKAFDLMNKFLPLFEKGEADLQASITYLRGMSECTGKVGVAGYCLGGSLAYACATNPAITTDASVGYYPVQIDDYLQYAGNIDKPAMFHIAEKDGFCPPESQQKIKDALGKNPNCAVYSYPGVDHAFAREGGANFNADAARQANERTAAFLEKNLG